MLTFPLVSGVLHQAGPITQVGHKCWDPSYRRACSLFQPRDYCAWEGCMRIIHSLALSWKQLEDKRNARDIYQVTMSSHGLG